MKVVFITVSTPAMENLLLAKRTIDQLSPSALDLTIYYAIEEPKEEAKKGLIEAIEQADAVFLDQMGSPPKLIDEIDRILSRTKSHVIPFGAASREFMRLGKFSAETMRRSGNSAPSMEKMKKMQTFAEKAGKFLPGVMRDMRNYSLCMKYFQYPTKDNILNLLLLLLRDYGSMTGLPVPKPPHEAKPIAWYQLNTMESFDNPEAYKKTEGFSPEKPNVILFFSAQTYPTDNTSCLIALRDSLSAFSNVYSIGTADTFASNEAQLRRMVESIDGGVDLIVNTSPFRLSAGPMGGEVERGVAFLKEMDVPYLHPFFLTRRTEEEWRLSINGCTPSENLISIMLPELDGSIDTIPIGASSSGVVDPQSDIKLYTMEPIHERIAHVSRRAERMIRLRKKNNSDKKIAIICYNYPPGEANLFGGAFLDTFSSVAQILECLKEVGYATESMSSDELKDIFRAGRAVNSGHYETQWAQAIYYSTDKYEAPVDVTEHFGRKPGNIMVHDRQFFIPGIISGNVFIGLQPARGGDSLEDYHDKKTPPHHQYCAYYQWLREEFQADAVVHVGTHGTLEFTLGKESGMSAECYPDRLIGELPHIYLYYLGNPAEAMIAKRRSHANLVSYQPPVFVQGELYGDYLELSSRLESYRQTLVLSPESSQAALEQLKEQAKTLEMPETIDEMEEELYRMQRRLIPEGLHVFGTGYSPDEQAVYHTTMFNRYKEEGHSAEEAEKMAREASAATAINNELEGLVHALAGGYNPARMGGDIYRNPEVFPAGFNLYQFDPRQIPSPAAMARGREIAENTIQKYFSEHGEYPRSCAVILWGLETSRTQGETLGQILGYLGVRFAKDTHIWQQKFELIPLEELGRPRIDVTINICGFFRDMFSTQVETLDDLFHELAQSDEPEESNFFLAHTRARYRRLIDEGYSRTEAKSLSSARIFGPAAGEYGTKLTDIIQSKNWEEESQLGFSFTASLRHVYGRDKHGESVSGLYEDNLRSVEVVSQLRSSHEYEVTDLDHYYEFFGGLAKSVELVKGRKVSLYITDVTETRPLTETVDRAIARGVRSRVLNPKWIQGLLKHPVHGAQQIADRFENILGMAATTGAVDQWVYNELNACYVEDERLRKQMIENNPHAYVEILERMMEYHRRGYWDASPEQLERIREIYLALDHDLEGATQ